MKTKNRANTLLLSDSPGCFWLFGLFFVLIGALAIYTVIGILSDESYSLIQKGFAFALGVASVGVGAFITYDAPGTKTQADWEKRILIIRRRGLMRSDELRIPIGEIERVDVVQRPDIDSDPVYSLSVHTRDGADIRLTRLWVHNRKKLEENAEQLRGFLESGKIPPAAS